MNYLVPITITKLKNLKFSVIFLFMPIPLYFTQPLSSRISFVLVAPYPCTAKNPNKFQKPSISHLQVHIRVELSTEAVSKVSVPISMASSTSTYGIPGEYIWLDYPDREPQSRPETSTRAKRDLSFQIEKTVKNNRNQKMIY